MRGLNCLQGRFSIVSTNFSQVSSSDSSQLLQRKTRNPQDTTTSQLSIQKYTQAKIYESFIDFNLIHFFLCKTKNRVSIQKKEFLYIFFIFGLLHKKEPLVNMSDAFLAVCFCIFLQENSAEQKMQSADVAHRKMMTTN